MFRVSNIKKKKEAKIREKTKKDKKIDPPPRNLFEDSRSGFS